MAREIEVTREIEMRRGSGGGQEGEKDCCDEDEETDTIEWKNDDEIRDIRNTGQSRRRNPGELLDWSSSVERASDLSACMFFFTHWEVSSLVSRERLMQAVLWYRATSLVSGSAEDSCNEHALASLSLGAACEESKDHERLRAAQ